MVSFPFLVPQLLFWHRKPNQISSRPSVLPKFEVKVVGPDTVSVGKEELELDACAK